LCIMFRLLRLATLAIATLHAQSGEFSLRVWRTQDGLPQNRIQALTQTPDGYLWVGTPAGLARFDGLRFKVFDRANTPAFRDDSILSLSLGRENTLWVGTEGGGLLRYQHGVFTRLDSGAGLTNDFIRSLVENNDGNLWIGTDRGFFLRSPDGSIQRMDRTAELPEAAIVTLRLDAQGHVWAASNQGLLQATGRKVQPFRVKSLPPGTGRALLMTDAGVLWVSQRGKVRRIQPDTTALDVSIGAASATALHESHGGQIWIGTMGDGLLMVKDNKAVQAPLPTLPDQSVLTLFEDREHSIWAGTLDGLARITRSAVETLSARHGLPNDNVSTIFEDRDGAVWIGTITAEMSRLASGSASPVMVTPPVSGFRTRSVYRDRKGDLWFGSAGDGLAHFSGGVTRVFNRKDGLRSNSVRQILEDRNGTIWAALGSGLVSWDGQKIKPYYLEDGLSYGGVRSLLELPNGDLLVGTDGGVSRMRDLHFISDPTLAPLKDEKIWAMLSDSSGNVWFGTRGGGLYRLRDGSLRRITAQDGLPGNNVYALLDDSKGNLWMSGSFGIASVPWKELDRFINQREQGLAVTTYGMADGLQSTEMNGGFQPAAMLSKSGDIWFASVKGAVRIKANPSGSKHRTQVLIESLQADEETLALSGPLSISAGKHRLQISFTDCDLLSSPHTKFRYKLEGFDTAWTTDSQRRTAVYTNLPPGDFTFRVASIGGIPSESSIAFKVLPKFYQTSLFLAFVVLFIALLIWGSFVFYARQTRYRFALLFGERTRLAREMHDTVIQGCVGVSTLLEAAVANPAGTPGKELVDMARKQVRLTLDEARQAVWDLRHKEVEGDLASSLREFAGRFAMESPVPIGLEVSGPNVRLDDRAERNLLLVAREAIRNALSHASPAHIDLHLRFEPTAVSLEVRDDGTGFQPSPLPQSGHYGIIGMRERVAELGGSLEIHSQPGQGTCLLVRMPLEVQPQ
jgi:ligand-binding sensor domain-containing protein